MVAGTALVLLVGARSEPAREPREKPRHEETPWLTKEATAQIVGSEGTLGPLFAGIVLGGPAPSPEDRARIAEFARANHVRIDLQIVDGDLAAIQFEVAYGGCCGYEGADVLAFKLGQPSTGSCCVCGEDTWINDWAVATPDGNHMRVRLRVNRVVVRWEPEATLDELLDSADGLLGRTQAEVRKAAGDRWVDFVPGEQALLEEPYPFTRYPELSSRGPVGFQVRAEHGRIAEVSFALFDRDHSPGVDPTLRARWGRPRTTTPETWTWQKPDRTIEVERGGDPSRVTIRAR